jgi:enoyl-CoA hydratase
MTSVTGNVEYQVRGSAGVVTINRPERRNALSNAVLRDLRAGLRRAQEDPAARVVVLTGAGGEAFCAGGDLREMADRRDPVDEHQGRGDLAEIFKDLWKLGKPTIARVDGFCLAGGFGLALACDIVLATQKSVFGAPEVKVGLWPYMITVPLLRSMRPKDALRLMMTGEIVSAQRGVELGFVSEVVPDGGMDERVSELAQQLARVSPQAVRLGRSSFYSVVDADVGLRLSKLHADLGLALTTPDASEGLAAFAEKRPPAWAAWPTPTRSS